MISQKIWLGLCFGFVSSVFAALFFFCPKGEGRRYTSFHFRILQRVFLNALETQAQHHHHNTNNNMDGMVAGRNPPDHARFRAEVRESFNQYVLLFLLLRLSSGVFVFAFERSCLPTSPEDVVLFVRYLS